MAGLDPLERQDRMDRVERLEREDRLGGMERQGLVEVGDLYFRVCYWFNLCDLLAVVPETITHFECVVIITQYTLTFSHRARSVLLLICLETP